MIKNQKGFVITEVLILSTVIMGVLVFMYAQFKSINRNYQYSFKYDTPEAMFLANNIVNYINDRNYDKLVELLNNTDKGYIDITECNINNSNLISYCSSLFQKSEIEQIIFTEENLIKLKQNINDFNNEMKNYITQIKPMNEQSDYRIIVKYQDGTFASMRFNKGNVYVEDGLITYLDGINNTGNGHSNETTLWKDLSNHGNDATLYNNPTWSNNSLTFDGIDDYGILTNTANDEFPNGITLETRVKVLSITDFGGATYNMFIDNVTTSDVRNGISQSIMKNLSGFRTRVGTGTNSFSTIQNPTPCSIESYYTITTIYDNNYMKFYVNGEHIQTNNITGVYAVSETPFYIGKTSTSISSYANVEFQNVLIYDRALTENEVLRNYQADLARY